VEGLREAVAGGGIDKRFIAAARSVARSASRTRPPPTGATSWSDEDIDDLVFDTVARVGPGDVVLAAQQADSDAAFRGWLRRAVRTTLNLRARGTSAGRVIRAVDDALRQDPEGFRLDGDYWRLADDGRDPAGTVGTSAVVEVAWTVNTTTVRISADATKTPPMAYRRDIRAVCAAVLAHFGPLRKVDLAEVLAYRFNVAFEDRFDYLDLDDEEDGHQPVAAAAEEAFDDVDDDVAARWMLDQLTGEERRLLGLIVQGATIRDLAAELDCTRYRAEVLSERVQQKLRRLADLVPDGDGAAVTERLLGVVRQQEELRHLEEHDGADDGD
jgi:DNA-binding CsgD family transcriptional regulator